MLPYTSSSDFYMHVGYEETSQSKILKSQICVQKRGVCIILRKGQLKGPSKYVQLKIINFLVTLNMPNIRWSTFLSTSRMGIVLVVNV